MARPTMVFELTKDDAGRAQSAIKARKKSQTSKPEVSSSGFPHCDN